MPTIFLYEVIYQSVTQLHSGIQIKSLMSQSLVMCRTINHISSVLHKERNEVIVTLTISVLETCPIDALTGARPHDNEQSIQQSPNTMTHSYVPRSQ